MLKKNILKLAKVVLGLSWVLVASSQAFAYELSLREKSLLQKAKVGGLASMTIQMSASTEHLKAYGLTYGSYKLEDGSILKVKPENRDGALCKPNAMVNSTLTTLVTTECTRYSGGKCVEQESCKQDTCQCVDSAGNTYRVSSEKYECVVQPLNIEFSGAGTSSGF